MKLIVDTDTISDDEINQIKGFEIIRHSFVNPIKEVSNDLTVSFIQLSRFPNKIKCVIFDEDESVEFVPPLILLGSKEYWHAESEMEVDAKTESIDTFNNKEFHVLCGESFIFSNMILQKKKHFTFIISQHKLESGEDITCLSLGRYYPTKHIQSNLLIYTSAILKAKNDVHFSSVLYGNLYRGISKYLSDKYDYVFYVPNKEGSVDRFASFIADNGVKLKRQYGKIKDCDKPDRKLILKDAFEINKDVIGKRILLVDDIITTGSTLEEITGELLKAGASKVIWLTFAQSTRYNEVKLNYTCEKCGKNLRIKFNKTNCNWFIGCSGFIDNPSCKTIYQPSALEAQCYIHLD